VFTSPTESHRARQSIVAARPDRLRVEILAPFGSAFVLVLPGPSPHVEPDVIDAGMTLALQHENDRLEALSAVRAAGSRAAASGRTPSSPRRPRVVVATGPNG